METRKLVGVWRLLPVTALLVVGGCSNAVRSDSADLNLASRCTAGNCAGAYANPKGAAFVPRTHERTRAEYARQCDEQTRSQQHELANCTAVPLIDISTHRKS